MSQNCERALVEEATIPIFFFVVIMPFHFMGILLWIVKEKEGLKKE